MIETICTTVSLIWFVGSLIFVVIFGIISEQDDKTVLKALNDLIIDLFCDKNWVGILLSVLIFISLIPSYIFAFVIKVICMFCNVLLYIWKLGEKR